MRWNNTPAQILICETSREVSEQNILGAQGPPPLNLSQWHIDYFELKLLREDPMQESSQVMLVVKNPPANAGDIKMRVQSLGWEDPLEEGTAIHSNILAWRIPSTEEPGRLYSPWGRKRVRHD